MVIEHFKDGDPAPVYRRFRERGRLAPDGLTYINSWVDVNLERCYQVMETGRPRAAGPVDRNWRDIVEFEVHPVITSATRPLGSTPARSAHGATGYFRREVSMRAFALPSCVPSPRTAVESDHSAPSADEPRSAKWSGKYWTRGRSATRSCSKRSSPRRRQLTTAGEWRRGARTSSRAGCVVAANPVAADCASRSCASWRRRGERRGRYDIGGTAGAPPRRECGRRSSRARRGGRVADRGDPQHGSDGPRPIIRWNRGGAARVSS